MRRIELDLAETSSGAPPLAARSLALGVFDALHLGHKALIERLVEMPGDDPAVLATFSCHPQEILGGIAPSRVLHPKLRDRLLEEWGVEVLVTIKTNSALLGLEAEEFLKRLHAHVRPRAYLVGPDFRFGKGRRGDIETIRRAGIEEVITVPIVRSDESDYSATSVRWMLGEGRVREVADILGRNFAVIGIEERGDGIGGRELDAPTVNLFPPPEILRDGIYVVRTSAGDGVCHLGPRPALKSDERRFEVHILDRVIPRGEAGNEWEVEFLERLRDVEDFASMDELRTAIARDVAGARKVLA